jgi:hypothetical protein
MHCANCRCENAPTTRFCTGCGAVLVESTPDGRRRRVLRPWGLSRSAPLTVSPDMPEIRAMRGDPARPLSRRLDLRFAAGTAVVALAGTFLYPYARGLDTPPAAPAPVEVFAESTTSTHAVRETVVAAPALIEPVTRKAPAVSPARDAARDPSAAPRPALMPTTPAPLAPVPEAPKVVAITAPAPALAPAVVDRWQPLKDALDRCTARSGIFERASCEQGARLAHCEGYWGQQLLCPAARTDYGQ